MRRILGLGMAAAATMVVLHWGVLGSLNSQANAQRPKHSIKHVMKVGMKGGLLRAVVDGEASPQQRSELIELLESLAQSQPRKGSADSWRAKTSAMLTAAKSGNAAALKSASSCLNCHKVHK